MYFVYLLLSFSFSQFNIVANETHATIERCSIDEFASFAFVPVKKMYDYYKLGDIIANGQNLNFLHLNLLAVLRDVSFLRFKRRFFSLQ